MQQTKWLKAVMISRKLAKTHRHFGMIVDIGLEKWVELVVLLVQVVVVVGEAVRVGSVVVSNQ